MPRSAEGAAAFRARVEGRVQGVGFRYSARERAAGLGLVGWVRNDDDGSVEAWFEGPAAACLEFAAWLEEGPPGARVDAARIERAGPLGSYRRFSVEP